MIDYRHELEVRGMDIKISGHNLMMKCPFHNDTVPSFGVDSRTGVYHCLSGSCGVDGPFYRLIAELDGISEDEARHLLRYYDGEQLENVVQEFEKVFNEGTAANVKTFLNKESVYAQFESIEGTVGEAYLIRRGIQHKVMETYELMWGGKTGRWANRVIIPVFDEMHRLVTITGRTILDNTKPEKQKARGRKADTLFGIHLIKKMQPYLIVVEGEFDVMTLWQNGFNAVGLLGSELKLNQTSQIMDCAECVVLLFDGDKAGREGSRKAKRTLSRLLPTYSCKLKEGIDPNTMTDVMIEQLRHDVIDCVIK